MNKQETTGKQFYETADKIITVEKQEKSYSEEDTREKPLNQNKITAVEWLIEQIFLNKKYITYEESIIFEQAKQIEKQRHKKFNDFLQKEIELGISDKATIERIEWYYNTYFINNE